MNLAIVPEFSRSPGNGCHPRRIDIDASAPRHDNPWPMKRLPHRTTGFSLVEVTLALGVAAFCLLVLLGLLPAGVKTQQSSIQQTTANQIISQIFSFLRADVRLPPGKLNKFCGDRNTFDWSRLKDTWIIRGL